MNMKRLLLASVILGVLVSNSCKKKEDNNTPVLVYGTYSSIDTIFTILGTPSKFVTFDATTGASFYGASGTRYIIPGGSFQDASGTVVTGLIQMEVKELVKKGDMVFSSALPVCNGDPLVSGGEIYTNATQSGQQLYLRPGYTFQANIPQGTTPTTGLSLFLGTTIPERQNAVVWKPSDSISGGTILYNGDSVNIISDSLHWCNADRFLSNPNYQNFKVTLSITGSPTVVPASFLTYTFYDQYKGVWPMGSPSNNVISEGHVPNIPVHLVSFGILNKKFYGGVSAVTPVTNGNYTITMSEVDPVAFKGQLNNLTN